MKGSIDFKEKFAKAISEINHSASTAMGMQSYSIIEKIGHVYLGVSSASLPVLLLELPVSQPAIIRTAGFVASNLAAVKFNVEGRSWNTSCFVLESCSSVDLKLFEFLCLDIYNRTSGLPPSNILTEIKRIVKEWIRFFQRSQVLSFEEQCGLWGELSILANIDNPSDLLQGWNGPEGDEIDFWIGGYGLEVKTSQKFLRHTFSISQVRSSFEDERIYIASVHIKRDDRFGRTLADLAQDIIKKLSEPTQLISKLPLQALSAISSGDLIKFSAAEPTQFFKSRDVPQVRVLDPGVISVRFESVLDEKNALSACELPVIFSNLYKSR